MTHCRLAATTFSSTVDDSPKIHPQKPVTNCGPKFQTPGRVCQIFFLQVFFLQVFSFSKISPLSLLFSRPISYRAHEQREMLEHTPTERPAVLSTCCYSYYIIHMRACYMHGAVNTVPHLPAPYLRHSALIMALFWLLILPYLP